MSLHRAKLPEVAGPLYLRPEDAVVQPGGIDVPYDGLNVPHDSDPKPAPLPSADDAQFVQLAALDRVARSMQQVVERLDRQYSRSADTTEVNADTSAVTLLDYSRFRHGGTIYNDSSAVMYLKLGPTATTDSFSAKLNAGDYYELPYGYSGIVTAVWATATGSARVTEMS